MPTYLDAALDICKSIPYEKGEKHMEAAEAWASHDTVWAVLWEVFIFQTCVKETETERWFWRLLKKIYARSAVLLLISGKY